MSEHEKPDAIDKLVDAYERMLKGLHEGVEQAEKETVPAVRDLLTRTRDTMVELGELTREEANRVAEYVERDIKDAGKYIAETGEDLKTWWRFDLDLIEDRLLNVFSQIADQTSLQLHRWTEQARQAGLYHTGEIAGPGTLTCDACGAQTFMRRPGRIPPCPKCGATGFKRIPEIPVGSREHD